MTEEGVRTVLVVKDEPSGAPNEKGWRVGFVSAMAVIDGKLILNWYHIRVESKEILSYFIDDKWGI